MHHVDPLLLTAVVLVESSGNPFAWNPEPRYRWLWDVRELKPYRPVSAEELAAKFPPSGFPALGGDPDQEWWGQQASWGLCQIMGAVARERGFSGPYLTQLCDPTINLDLGATHLASLLAWAKGREGQALEAWNGGKGNVGSAQTRAYAARVLAKKAGLSHG